MRLCIELNRVGGVTDALSSVLSKTTSLFPNALFASLGVPGRDESIMEAGHARIIDTFPLYVSTNGVGGMNFRELTMISREVVKGSSRSVLILSASLSDYGPMVPEIRSAPSKKPPRFYRITNLGMWKANSVSIALEI
jgi:hypothetical protein